MKTKTFDCLKMKDEAQQRRSEALKGMSEQQRLEYYRRAHEDLVQRQKALRAVPQAGPGSQGSS
ncbi:MAG: hypothetical protein V3W34_11420 [Phycisphaerae bacterium]